MNQYKILGSKKAAEIVYLYFFEHWSMKKIAKVKRLNWHTVQNIIKASIEKEIAVYKND